MKEVSTAHNILSVAVTITISDIIAFEQVPSGVVAPETPLTFNCEAVGSQVNWHINGIRRTRDDSNEEYQIHDELISNSRHNLTLTMVAGGGENSNNNTQITCFARGSQSGQIEARSLHIIIAGKSC